MKIILLNGPPRSGKDYAGAILQRHPCRDQVVKFAEELKVRTHALYQLDRRADWFEDCKDEPRDEFLGLTPRQAYIGVSELLIKPQHGAAQFGHWLADSIERQHSMVDTVIVTDSGFRSEAEVLVERFGAANCLLARIHRTGYTFSSDSRSYIDLSDLGVQCLDLQNDGGPGFRTLLGALPLSSRV